MYSYQSGGEQFSNWNSGPSAALEQRQGWAGTDSSYGLNTSLSFLPNSFVFRNRKTFNEMEKT